MRKLFALFVLIPGICLAEPVSDKTLKALNKSIEQLTQAIKEHTKAIKNSALTVDSNQQSGMKSNWDE